MAKRFKSKLDVTLFNNLNQMFTEKDWVNNIPGYDSFLDKYYNFLENLNNDEKDLILELTKDYLYVAPGQYFRRLIDVSARLSEYDLNLDNVYVLPILSQEDRQPGKVKSGGHTSYYFKNKMLNNYEVFAESKFHVIENLEGLPFAEKIAKKKHPIVLVDDYVGTGESAITALEELFKVQNYDKKFVFVITLVSQEIGMKAIKAQGCNFLTGQIRKKGISDKYGEAEAKVKIEIMLNLEEKMGVKERFRLGYGGSEGLVTMMRTPNNTFPAYWLEPKNKKWKPPFER